MSSRNLMTISRNIMQGLGRIIQETARDGLENRQIFGAMETDQSVQELATAPSTTQRHEIGTRLVTKDGRAFRYAMAGGTLNCDLGCSPQYTQEVGYTTIAASAVLGATTLVLDVVSGDGIAADGVIAVDYLKGGYIVVFEHTENAFVRMITANTVTSGAGEMTITLDSGIPVALVVDVDHGECMASPYANVISSTSNQKSVVGVPDFAMTVGQYGWIQTWGPCWMAPQGAVSTGNNDRQVVFRHDGSIDQHDYSDGVIQFAQHAGFILKDIAGGGQGAPFVMLQITP